MKTFPTVVPIPVATNISPEAFLRDYQQPQMPAILKGWMNDWPAAKWDFDFFKQHFGHIPVQAAVDLTVGGLMDLYVDANVKDMSTSAFIDLVQDPRRSKPCYLYQMQASRFPGASEALRFPTFPHLGEGYSTDYAMNVWLGSENTKLTFHFDLGDNFLAQIQGTKRVRLVRMKDSRCMYPSRRNLTESEIDSDDFNAKTHPRFLDATVYEAILQPGDIVYIPKGCWHEVLSLTRSISINQWFGRKIAGQAWPLLKACGFLHYCSAARQFLLYVLANKKRPRARLFSDMTTGELLWSEWRGRRRSSRERMPNAPIDPNQVLEVCFPLSHLVGPFEDEESVYIYAEGKGSHVVMSIETLPMVEELTRRSEFRAHEAMHWGMPGDCTWPDIEPLLAELLDQGYLRRSDMAAAA